MLVSSDERTHDYDIVTNCIKIQHNLLFTHLFEQHCIYTVENPKTKQILEFPHPKIPSQITTCTYTSRTIQSTPHVGMKANRNNPKIAKCNREKIRQPMRQPEVLCSGHHCLEDKKCFNVEASVEAQFRTPQCQRGGLQRLLPPGGFILG
jgi:hypothetical protein